MVNSGNGVKMDLRMTRVILSDLQVTGKKYPNMRHSNRHTKPFELPVPG